MSLDLNFQTELPFWNKEISIEETLQAEAGTVVVVEQVVGRCGDAQVRTDEFKIVLKSGPTFCTPSDDIELVVNCDALDSLVAQDLYYIVHKLINFSYFL